MQTITEAHEAINVAAKSADNKMRIVDKIDVGEYARQGDLYLLRIDKINERWVPTENTQLAPGVSSGSRHVADGSVSIFRSPEAIPIDRNGRAPRLLGPQVSSSEGFVVTHPEHAHIQLPAGTYQVLYQLDFQRQRAVRD